jgi:hypothetical protein
VTSELKSKQVTGKEKLPVKKMEGRKWVWSKYSIKREPRGVV